MSLLDTQNVIELLRKRRYEAGSISIITLIEVLRGLEAGKGAKVKELLEESFHVLDLDNPVIETYCRLYRQLKDRGPLLPDADLLLASTAIAHNLPLKTRDAHFKRLKELGLKLANQA